jgi:predicted PurR-regulated permease PerM
LKTLDYGFRRNDAKKRKSVFFTASLFQKGGHPEGAQLMIRRPLSRDITRIILSVLFIGALIAASFYILQPFLLAIIWAATIVVSTWPIMLLLQRWLAGKRLLAVAVMTLGLLLVFIIPFSLAVGTIVGHSDQIIDWAKGLSVYTLPPPPEWVGKLPVVGARLSETWGDFAAAGAEGLRARLAPYTGAILKWFAERAGGVGMMFVQFLLTVIISAVLYAGGETAAAAFRRFAFRLAGKRGEDVAILAAKTIRSVALGVVLTALVQSLIGGVGLWVAGVPFPALLAAVIFILALAQLPPVLVLGPAVFWLYWKGDPVWGTALLVWTIVVASVDNILRPLLIRKGIDLPLILIFAGVLGGLVAFGIIGLFIGPVVLAVTYKLLEAWVAGDEQEPAPASAITPIPPTEAGERDKRKRGDDFEHNPGG